MTKKGKIAWVVIFVLIAVSIGFATVKRLTKVEEFNVISETPRVSVGTMEKRDILNYLDLTGTIKNITETSVTAKTSGEVLEVLVSEGDTVAEGDVLYRLDTEDAKISAKTSLDSASIALRQAQDTLNRNAALYAAGNVSQSQYEQYVDAVETATLQYNTAEKAYNDIIENSEVKANVAGVVDDLPYDVHDMVASGGVVATIISADNKEVVFNVTKEVKENLAIGDTVELTNSNATITEIGNSVESNGLFEIKAVLDSSDDYAVGQTVKLTVVADSAISANSVPYDSIYYDGGKSYIYKYVDGVIAKTEVTLGVTDNEYIEVIDGISETDEILTTWTSELGDGTEVIKK